MKKLFNGIVGTVVAVMVGTGIGIACDDEFVDVADLPQPIRTENFEMVRRSIVANQPAIVTITWPQKGWKVLDDYGHLAVERDEDLINDAWYETISCYSYSYDLASDQPVFICGSFPGEWVPEGLEGEDRYLVSRDEGYTRSFMIRASDLEWMFANRHASGVILESIVK